MAAVVARLAAAVAPGGHLLVVGHAPSGRHVLAADLVPALPESFEPVVVEQRPRTVTRDGETIEIDDSTLFARRG
jgi:hypothetical protein